MPQKICVIARRGNAPPPVGGQGSAGGGPDTWAPTPDLSTVFNTSSFDESVASGSSFSQFLAGGDTATDEVEAPLSGLDFNKGYVQG